jgi:hypothetical protein
MAHGEDTRQRKPDPPPALPCDDCAANWRCVMRGALSREIIYSWLADREITGCTFHEPITADSYHGLEGVRA